MSKLIQTIFFITFAITLLSAAPTKDDIPQEITKNVGENLKYYIIGAIAVVCVIIALMCWTAAKGCCCLIKIGLLVACGAALFFFVIKGTMDYKEILTNTQSCDKNENCDENEDATNNYDEFSNKIITTINSALSSYKPCNSSNCSCHIEVLKADLAPFKSGITRETLDKIKDRGTVYQIIDNKIYRQRDCNFPSRCSGVEYFIKRILKKIKLPAMELVINVRDYPQIMPHYGVQGPVLSFSKTDSYIDIMYPAWAFYEGGPAIKLYPTGLGRWDLHRDSLTQAADKFPWPKKLSMAFFRGSRTSDERDALILLSRSHPKLADAKYTKNQAWKSMKDTLNEEPADEVSLEDHCKYKFLFNYRGVAASFRFKHLFLCKSLVFHVGNEWKEFFYDSLKPWIHYVPIDAKSKPDDLKKLIKFFAKNDEIAREIAERGHEMIWKNLRMEDVECYWRRLLRSYGRLIKFEVVKNDDFIEV